MKKKCLSKSTPNPKNYVKANKRTDNLAIYLLVCGLIIMMLAISFYFIGHFIIEKKIHNVIYYLLKFSKIFT